MQISQKRKDWIDALRAMAILLVVYGHQVQWLGAFFTYTSPIKVPLFFIISGYLFSFENSKTIVFLKKITRRLILPYILLSFIASLVMFPFLGASFLRNSCVGIISGSTYWFMPTLIIAEILFFYINKLCSQKSTRCLCSILLFMIGSIFVAKSVLEFAMINIALEVQIYLFIGSVFREFKRYTQNISTWILFFLSVVYIVLCYVGSIFGYTTNFDPHIGEYGVIVYTFMLIFLGVFILFSLAPRIKSYPRFLLFIGKNTLLLYLWSNVGITFFYGLLKILNIAKPTESVCFGLVSLLAAVIFCSICSLIINKYLPFLVGK